MASLETGEAHATQRLARAREIPAHREGDLVLGPLPYEVATRVLGEVAGAAATSDATPARLEQARGQLREGGLPRAVRADERNDLAAAELEADSLEHACVPVGER